MRTLRDYMRIVLLAVFVLVTIASFRQFVSIQSIATFPDSDVYMAAARAPLFSSQIWAGQRAPGYPIFIKSCFGSTDEIARSQYLFSFACWTFLAFCCLRVFSGPVAKVLGFTLFMTQILSPGVYLWHKVILSESVSFSLLAVCTGCWILFVHRKCLLNATIAVVATAAWVGVRDTNAYQAVFLGVFLLLSIGYRALRKPVQPFRSQRLVIGVAVMLFVIFAGSDISSNRGGRWLFPFCNNVAQRVLPSEERTAWFAARGMPVTPALVERRGKWASSDGFAFFNDENLAGFREWTRVHGKSTYIEWLILHPAYTFYESARGFSGIFDTNYAEYAPRGLYPPGPPPYTLGSAAAVLYAFVIGFFCCYCLLPHVCRSVCVEGKAKVGLVAVPMLMLPGILFGHLAVWHGDAMEIVRHSAQTVVQLKIVVCLLAACAADQAQSNWKTWKM